MLDKCLKSKELRVCRNCIRLDQDRNVEVGVMLDKCLKSKELRVCRNCIRLDQDQNVEVGVMLDKCLKSKELRVCRNCIREREKGSCGVLLDISRLRLTICSGA